MLSLPKPIVTEIALKLSYSDIGQFAQTAKSLTWTISDRHLWNRKLLSETVNYMLICDISRESYTKRHQCDPDAPDLRLEYVKLLSKKIKTYVPGMEKFLKPEMIVLRVLRSKNIPLSLKLLKDNSSNRNAYNYHKEIYLATKHGLVEVMELLIELEKNSPFGKHDIFARLLGLARAGGTDREAKFNVLFKTEFKNKHKTNLQKLINIIINISKILIKAAKSGDESFFLSIFFKYEEYYSSFDIANYDSDDCYHELGDIHFDYEHHDPASILEQCMWAAATRKISICNLIERIAIEKQISKKKLIRIYDAGLKSAAKRGNLDMLNHFIERGAREFENAILSACKKTNLHILETLFDQPTIFQQFQENGCNTKGKWSPESIVSSACEYGCQEAMEVIFRRLNELDLLTLQVFESAITRCLSEDFPQLLNWICQEVKSHFSVTVLKDLLRNFILTGTECFSVSEKNKCRLIALRQAKIEWFYTGIIPQEPPKEPQIYMAGCSPPPTKSELAFQKFLTETVWF